MEEQFFYGTIKTSFEQTEAINFVVNGLPKQARADQQPSVQRTECKRGKILNGVLNDESSSMSRGTLEGHFELNSV